MKAQELRDMTAEQLAAKLAELKEELFNLRFQLEVQQLENPHKIKDVKHDIPTLLCKSVSFVLKYGPSLG